MVRFKLPMLVALLAVLLAPSSPAATVRTLDGKTYDGEIKFDANQLVVTPRSGLDIKLDMSNILLASFKSTKPAAPASQAAAPGPLGLPDSWQLRDIATNKPALAKYADRQFRIMAGGAGIEGPRDSGGFVCQQVAGDASLVVHLSKIELGNPLTMVGVMVRDKFDPGSRMVAFVVRLTRHTLLLRRHKDGAGMNQMAATTGDAFPVWLKLTRKGTTWDAFTSRDGANWVSVGETDVELSDNVYWGMVVSNRKGDDLCTACFDNVSLGNTTGGVINASAPVIGKCLMLRSGSVIAVSTVASIANKLVSFTGADGRQAALPAADVARIILTPMATGMLGKLPDRNAGVLLARGDFVEGEIRGFDGRAISLSSVLFGLSNFVVGSEAVAVALAAIDPPHGAFIVRTANGNSYLANSAKIDADTLVIEEDFLGTVRLARADLAEIRVGGGRFSFLSELQPPSVETHSGVVPSTAWTVHSSTVAGASLDGIPCANSITCLMGTSLSWNLDGQYKLFVCRGGVSDASPPTVAVKLVVLGDGKELYCSPPRTSRDEAGIISVNVSNVKMLTLFAHPVVATGPGTQLPVTVLWSEPSLTKR